MSTDSLPTPDGLVLRHDLENRTYEAILDNDVVGLVIYEPGGVDRLVLTRAAVEEHHRHHGIGTQLFSYMFDDVRSRHEKVSVFCAAVADFLEHHDEYLDLIDRVDPGLVRPLIDREGPK
jgi:predicted GNAT family acetyltransferase